MRNHSFVSSLLILLSVSLSSFAESKCLLISSNPNLRKYEFKCENERIDIQCESSDEFECEIEISNKLKKRNFKISADKLAQLGIFKKDEQLRVRCESKFKICNYTSDVCKEYEGSFESSLSGQLSNLKENSSRCDVLGLGDLNKTGKFTTEFISESVYSKKDCSDKTQANFQALQLKLDIFRSNISLPIVNGNNYLNKCISFPNLKKKDGLAKAKEELERLRNLVLAMTKSPMKLKELLCQSEIASLYDNSGNLNMDTLTCMVVEDASLSVGVKDYSFNCERNNVGTTIRDNTGDSQRSDDFDRSRAGVAQNLAPASQQPMPTIVAEATEAPIGLRPALASIDSMAPNGYNSGASSEGSMGSGAVRSYGGAPDIALRAGQVIAPIVSKFRAIADSAVSASPSKRTSSSRTLADGYVVPKNIGVGLGSKITLSGSGSSVKSVAAVTDKGGDIELQLDSSEQDNVAALASAGSRLPRSPEVSSGSVVGPGRNNTRMPSADLLGSGPSGPGSSDALQKQDSLELGNSTAELQKRISKLSKPEDIRKFFTQEAAKYAQLRNLIYADHSNPIKTKLEELCIKIVSKSNRVSTNKKFKTPNIISDTGANFIPIKLGECKK